MIMDDLDFDCMIKDFPNVMLSTDLEYYVKKHLEIGEVENIQENTKMIVKFLLDSKIYVEMDGMTKPNILIYKNS